MMQKNIKLHYGMSGTEIMTNYYFTFNVILCKILFSIANFSSVLRSVPFFFKLDVSVDAGVAVSSACSS
jgi:hypothetical protein